MSQPVFVAMTIPCTGAEGPGERFALWTQGCHLGCPGCCNPELWAPGGDPRSVASLLADIDAERHRIEGVSLLGGEPFEQDAALAELARGVRALGLTVMAYSGFRLEELEARGSALLAELDVLVDGRYVESKRTTGRRWIGSSNQRLHFLTEAYAPDDPRFTEPNHAELRLDNHGRLTVVGFPFESVVRAFPKAAGPSGLGGPPATGVEAVREASSEARELDARGA